MATKVRRLRAVPALEALPEVRTVTVHGHRRAYRLGGAGPPVVLLHGIGDHSETWHDVLPELARDHLVIAPDLLGHGASAKPRGDYSVGGFANGVRDLLTVLGIDRATVVGHSLGAGVAMQFAYQYPDRCERVVLVSAGGVSRAVHPVLRALTLPGTTVVLSALRIRMIERQVRLALQLLRRLDTPTAIDALDLLRVIEGLPDVEARAAFVRTLRSVIDPRGQLVTMLDRCYLAEGMPTMLVWGSRDAVVPVHHAHRAHAAMPGSRLEIFEGAGHVPFRTHPERFVATLRDFLATTAPTDWDARRWREQLVDGPPASARVSVAHLARPMSR